MATPAQLQAQAAQLEIQIALLTQQISSANTPASQQASLIIQRSQLQNQLVIVQQETTAFTQQSNPPDPSVPAVAPGPDSPFGGAFFNNAPAPVDTPLLTPAESIARAQTTAPADVAPANTGIFANPNFSQEAISGTPTSAPAPVDTTVDRGNGSSYNPSNTSTPGANSFAAGAGTFEGGEAAYTAQLAREQAAIQAQFQTPADGDWRVRLALAPNATYLYKDSTNAVLKPLAGSNGVVFPYMPTIQTSYNADYSDTALTHSNYKGYFYNSSYVGDINITGIFTAQDTREANYLLAVIHFFRSVTKMFYGQDAQRGSPPPLVYLTGLGNYQFNNHPCVIKTFNYSLPNDVDYVRTKPNNYNLNFNQNLNKTQASPSPGIGSVLSRIFNSGLRKGALPGTGSQELVVQQSVTNLANSTYVPTRIEIQLTLMPIQTRSQQSQQFSVENYSSGKLLAGGFW
jgi:hypothetical protein